MRSKNVHIAIGLMSGTSLDGVDAALIETDGESHVKPLDFVTLPYAPELRMQIRECFGKRAPDTATQNAADALTRMHIDAIKQLNGPKPDIIGFHGQTITHDPANRFTFQIGNPAMLADATGSDVVYDFRSDDVAAGGHGAPLLPLYHRARAVSLPKPLAILNIGGVANVTWIGGDGDDDILAFDTGPGNALIDDFMLKTTGQPHDKNGALAAAGIVNQDVLSTWLAHAFFSQKPPKSLDRGSFAIASDAVGSNPADIAATLTAFTVQSIAQSVRWMPRTPLRWLVTGGGRHNAFMMRALHNLLQAPVDPVETAGWNGDALEAEGFGWLAVRHLKNLPLSLPSTTGAPYPLTGGKIFKRQN